MTILHHLLSYFLTLLLFFSFTYSLFSNQNLNKSSEPPCSIQWPIKTKYVTNLSSTFGESRLDHFHNGLDIGGFQTKIYPLQQGTILYKTHGSLKINEIPWGGGKTLIIQHEKCISGYMHLDSFANLLPSQENFVSLDKPIGQSGNTGHSVRPHLHFFLTNTKMDTLYNPLLVLDNTYYKDQKPPDEIAYYVKIEDDLIHFNPNKKVTLSQNFPFYVKIYDRGISNERWGVYEIKVFHIINQALIQHVVFDYLSLKKGHWYTSNTKQTTAKRFSEVYFQNYYYLGNNFQDNYYLSWIAQGIQGPQTKKEYKLDIIIQ